MNRLGVYKNFELIWTDNKNFRHLQTKLNLVSVCVEGVLVMIAHSGEWANYSDRTYTYVRTYARTLPLFDAGSPPICYTLINWIIRLNINAFVKQLTSSACLRTAESTGCVINSSLLIKLEITL